MKGKCKKLLALFLSVLMLVTTMPAVALPASAAELTDVTVKTLYHSTRDGGGRGDANTAIAANDGLTSNTMLAVVSFNISSLPQQVVTATLNLNATYAGQKNTNAKAGVYYATKNESVDAINDELFTNVFGDNNISAGGTSHVANAKSHFGLGNPVGRITVGTPPIAMNITAAVNEAKAAGKSTLTFIVLHDQAYNGSNSNGWSDINVNKSGTKITYSDTLPSAAEVRALNNNTISGVDTNTAVTTTNGTFQYDNDNVSTDDYNAVYKNVLYSEAVQQDGNGAAKSAQTRIGDGPTGGLEIQLTWYHARTTLMYDGTTTPTTGVGLYIDPIGTGGWNGQTDHMSCFVDTSGLEFRNKWHGYDTRLNFQYLWRGRSEVNIRYNKSIDKADYYQTNQKYYYANILYFTGTMGNDEYVRTLTPTFGYYGRPKDWEKNLPESNGGDPYVMATSSRQIQVINYKPLKSALENAADTINLIRANPERYDPNWVSSFVAAIGTLMAAKPNNFINSTSNNVDGYVSAARSAVAAYNDVNDPVPAKYGVVFKDYTGRVIETRMFDYGSSVTCSTIAPANSIVQKNNTHHTEYTWTNVIPTSSVTIQDNREYQEAFRADTEHTFTYANVDDNQHRATCSQCGYETTLNHNKTTTYTDTQHTITCSDNCGYTLTAEHTYGDPVTISEQTCYAPKRCSKTCTVCSYSYEYNEGEASNNHNFEWNGIAAGVEGSNVTPNVGAGTHNITCLNSGCTTVSEAIACTPVSAGEGTNRCICSVCGQELEHTWVWVVDTPACVDGVQHQECSVCHARQAEDTPIAATASHTPSGDWKYDEANGQHYKLCSVCGGEADKTACSWDAGVETKTPSCTVKGEKTYTCSVCHGTKIEEIDFADHVWSWVTDTYATCVDDGVQHEECANCDAIRSENTPISATGIHTPSDWQYDEANQQHYKTCSVCNDELERHGCEWNDGAITTAPGCTSSGERTFTCNVCGGTKKEPVSQNGHRAGEWEIESSADCDTDGEKVKRCTVCREVVETETIPATGHKYNTTPDSTVPSTCKTPGKDIYNCINSGCFNVKEVPLELDPNNHESTEQITVNAKPSTCKEKGYSGDICHACCNAVITAGSELPLADHTWDGGVVTKEPTYTEAGILTYTCTVCGETRTEPIELAAHTCQGGTPTCQHAAICIICKQPYGDVDPDNHENLVEIPAVDKTCTTPGSTAGEKCEACGVVTVTPETVPASHEWELKETIPGTCTIVGSEKYECSVCHDTKTESTGTDADNHVSSAWKKTAEPDCVNLGSESLICDACNATLDTRDVNPLGHDFSEWNIVKEANCTEGGSKTRECSRCDASETEDIQPLGHDWKTEWTVDVEANCKEAGSKSHHCKRCDAKKDVTVIPTLKHAWGEWTTVRESTCKDMGSQMRICSVCQAEDIGKLPLSTVHTPGEWVTEATSTCMINGRRVQRCTVCGAELGRETLPLTGHNWSEWAVAVEATCTAAGSEERHCTNCTKNETRPIALKAHTPDEGRLLKPATATEKGIIRYTCTVCGYVWDAEIDAVAHEHQGGAATCTKRAVCTICGLAYGEYDSSKHGAVQAVPEMAATCTKDGHTAQQKCSDCGVVIAAGEVIPALGHIDENGDALCDRCGSDPNAGGVYEEFRCSLCDTYEKMQEEGNPLIVIYWFIHLISHFVQWIHYITR